MRDFPDLDEEEARRWIVPPKGDRAFIDLVRAFFDRYGRSFPWRETDAVWPVLLSEVMLQQTQTARVLPKYGEFLSLWPTMASFAEAPAGEVLAHWSGLGYNRRALALRKTCAASAAYGFTLPPDEGVLRSLPGIGPSTAAAVLAFCYHASAVYLETNIRRALLHAFHGGERAVPDRVLREDLVRLGPKAGDPKVWYYALMDWGVLVGRLVPNPNKRSASYHRATPFAGSDRQVRGMIVRVLGREGALEEDRLAALLPFEPGRIRGALASLKADGLVSLRSGKWELG